MRSERVMQVAVGMVLAFSLLWTLAILVPDPVDSRKSTAPQMGLVVNGTRYVLDSNFDQTATGSNVHVIHPYASPAMAQRKLKGSATNTKRRLQSQPSATRTSGATTNGSSSSKKRNPLLPRWAWFSFVVVLNASRFVRRKRRKSYEEEDWFMKSGLDTQLKYIGAREYEDDFLSVDGSMYGSMSKWSGDELSKFDVDCDV